MAKSLAARVRDSEARKVKEGGRRLPGGVLPRDAAAALDVLQSYGYASSATGCIAAALVAECERLLKKESTKR